MYGIKTNEQKILIPSAKAKKSAAYKLLGPTCFLLFCFFGANDLIFQ